MNSVRSLEQKKKVQFALVAFLRGIRSFSLCERMAFSVLRGIVPFRNFNYFHGRAPLNVFYLHMYDAF